MKYYMLIGIYLIYLSASLRSKDGVSAVPVMKMIVMLDTGWASAALSKHAIGTWSCALANRGHLLTRFSLCVSENGPVCCSYDDLSLGDVQAHMRPIPGLGQAFSMLEVLQIKCGYHPFDTWYRLSSQDIKQVGMLSMQSHFAIQGNILKCIPCELFQCYIIP